jgi:hypothetical protein
MLDELEPVGLPPRLLSAWDRINTPLPKLVRDLLAGDDVAEWPAYINCVAGGCQQVTLGKHHDYTRLLGFNLERKKVYIDIDAVKDLDDSDLDYALRYVIATLVMIMLEIHPAYCPLIPEVLAGCWTNMAHASDEEEE